MMIRSQAMHETARGSFGHVAYTASADPVEGNGAGVTDAREWISFHRDAFSITHRFVFRLGRDTSIIIEHMRVAEPRCRKP